ncbi:PO6F1 factor, partial [Chordeiles acutipennis]|nr:PO6F1 factor [Chordeiles acutipennis]
GQVAGQQGLAVWTFPTATVAALPGLTAASPTGGIFKPPITNLQATAVLNAAIQVPVQATVQPRPPLQPPNIFPAAPSQPPILPQPTAAPTPPVAKPLETQTQLTVQPAGFAFSPGIISTASLGGQTQLLGSLAAAPVIANTISSVQGITGQILTNAQGQVIGTLPWVVNPPGMAAAGPAPATLPAQSLQVQTVTPQLLFNAQGQVIATLAGSTIQAATVKKTSTPEPHVKNEVQPIQPAPALSQPAVVVANPAPVAKASSTPVPITCSETPTVSQLVSSEQKMGEKEAKNGRKRGKKWEKRRKIGKKGRKMEDRTVGEVAVHEAPHHGSLVSHHRFEKLDITPKSAQKLKPVLEKWLSEAELRNQEGQQNLMEFVGGEPSKKRKRRTSFTPQAIEALNAYFEKNALPTGQEITEIAKELNYDREVVRVWFCNRRQTLKNTSKLNVFQ